MDVGSTHAGCWWLVGGHTDGHTLTTHTWDRGRLHGIQGPEERGRVVSCGDRRMQVGLVAHVGRRRAHGPTQVVEAQHVRWRLGKQHLRREREIKPVHHHGGRAPRDHLLLGPRAKRDKEEGRNDCVRVYTPRRPLRYCPPRPRAHFYEWSRCPIFGSSEEEESQSRSSMAMT